MIKVAMIAARALPRRKEQRGGHEDAPIARFSLTCYDRVSFDELRAIEQHVSRRCQRQIVFESPEIFLANLCCHPSGCFFFSRPAISGGADRDFTSILTRCTLAEFGLPILPSLHHFTVTGTLRRVAITARAYLIHGADAGVRAHEVSFAVTLDVMPRLASWRLPNPMPFCYGPSKKAAHRPSV